jgi:metal-dependent amidase/aminoacylase/carboxypeptidase family protein
MVTGLALRDEIGEWEPELIATRRDLHLHPEIGLQEVRTSGIVVDRLRAIGFDDVRTGIGVTGVKAVLRGGKPGKTLLLRADMDALPVGEETELEFRSRNPGTVHACGHDGHTSMLLATARLLHRHRDLIPGTPATRLPVYWLRMELPHHTGYLPPASINSQLLNRYPPAIGHLCPLSPAPVSSG